jgi:hypothetical protein
MTTFFSYASADAEFVHLVRVFAQPSLGEIFAFQQSPDGSKDIWEKMIENLKASDYLVIFVSAQCNNYLQWEVMRFFERIHEPGTTLKAIVVVMEPKESALLFLTGGMSPAADWPRIDAKQKDSKDEKAAEKVAIEIAKKWGLRWKPFDGLPLLSRIDNVHYLVSCPSSVQFGSKFLVDVWAHLEQQRAEVERQVQLSNPKSEIPLVIRPKGPFKIERGTKLFVCVKFQDFQVEPSEEVILWDGEITNASFSVDVPLDIALGKKTGLVTIHWVGGFQIARVPIQILVAEKVDRTIPMTHPVQQIHKAFASYASADRDEVLGRIQGMQKIAPNLDVFLDVVKFRSGEDWERKLWQVIPESDVLYLFWSAAAKASPWVEKEWRCALSTRGEEFIDPVPLVSPEEVPPPEELSKKHFNDWVLVYRRGRPKAD